MKLSSLVFTLLIAASQAAIASPPTPPSLVKHALELDKQSSATLGVGIRALGLLMNVRGENGVVFQKDFAEQDGTWTQLVALEKNGYATLKVVTGVPDGSSLQTKHVLAKLTIKGEVIAGTFDH